MAAEEFKFCPHRPGCPHGVWVPLSDADITPDVIEQLCNAENAELNPELFEDRQKLKELLDKCRSDAAFFEIVKEQLKVICASKPPRPPGANDPLHLAPKLSKQDKFEARTKIQAQQPQTAGELMNTIITDERMDDMLMAVEDLVVPRELLLQFPHHHLALSTMRSAAVGSMLAGIETPDERTARMERMLEELLGICDAKKLIESCPSWKAADALMKDAGKFSMKLIKQTGTTCAACGKEASGNCAVNASRLPTAIAIAKPEIGTLVTKEFARRNNNREFRSKACINRGVLF